MGLIEIRRGRKGGEDGSGRIKMGREGKSDEGAKEKIDSHYHCPVSLVIVTASPL